MMNKTTRESMPALGPALGALAARECRSLLRALAMRKKRQEGIHAARKSCRHLRSLLTLLPSDQPTDALDRNLKQLADELAPLRDAHIALHTARLLAAAHETWLTSGVIDALQQHCERVLDDALADDPNWRHRRAQAQRIVEALHALSWQDVRASVAKKTIKRSKRRVKKARDDAQAQATPATSHRWRRRARQLRYQLEFLRKAQRMAGMKKRYGERIKHLGALTDQLGWRQDFQIFLDAVQALPNSAEVRALRRQLALKTASWSKSEPRV